MSDMDKRFLNDLIEQFSEIEVELLKLIQKLDSLKSLVLDRRIEQNIADEREATEK